MHRSFGEDITSQYINRIPDESQARDTKLKKEPLKAVQSNTRIFSEHNGLPLNDIWHSLLESSVNVCKSEKHFVGSFMARF